MVSMRKLHSASTEEIRAMALRKEVIIADGEKIAKIVPVDYQATVPKHVDNQAKQAVGQARNPFQIPEIGSYHPVSKESQVK